MRKAHVETVAEVGGHYETWIKRVQWLIGITLSLLALFTLSKFWADVKDAAFSLKPDVQSRVIEVSNHLVVLVYAASWILGCLKDVALQKKIYTLVSESKEVKRIGNIMAPALGLAAVGMLCAVNFAPPIVFWVSLLFVIALDWIGWIWLMRSGLRNTFEECKDERLQANEETRVRDVIQLTVVRIRGGRLEETSLLCDDCFGGFGTSFGP